MKPFQPARPQPIARLSTAATMAYAQILRAATLLLLSSALSACVWSPETLPSPPPTVLPTLAPTATPSGESPLDPTACVLHLWHSFTGGKERALRALADAFSSDNPEQIRIRVEFHSPLQAEVRTALAAGTPPDIVIATPEQIVQNALTDAVFPLTSYLTDRAVGLGADELADLWPMVLQGVVLPGHANQALGLLFDIEIVVMYYNADWLEQLDADRPPQTWDEFRELADSARDRKAGTWGYAHTADGSMWANWITGLGGQLVDPRTGRVTLDSPEAVAALSVLQDLRADASTYCQSYPNEHIEDFASEKLLFAFGSSAEIRPLAAAILAPKTKLPLFDWNIAPMPHLSAEPIVSAQGSVMSILRTTPRQQMASWLFLRWFAQCDNDVHWALTTGSLPIHRSSQEAEQLLAYFADNPQYQVACQLLPHAQLLPPVVGWADIRALLAASSSAVCLGRAEPAEILSAADSAADSR